VKTLASILLLSFYYSFIFSIIIRFRFSTWYQSPRALTSNSILLLPHFKKKTIQNAPHHKSFFLRKMITELNPSLQDRKNPCFPITITYLTCLHARPKHSGISSVHHTRCRIQSSDLPLPESDSQNQHHFSRYLHPICLMEQKSSRSNGARTSTRISKFRRSESRAPSLTCATHAENILV
jgi:hypothetical protein